MEKSPRIFVDADACPVKDEVLRVADRHGLKSFFVTDGGIRPPASALAELVIVAQAPMPPTTGSPSASIRVTSPSPTTFRWPRGRWRKAPGPYAPTASRSLKLPSA